MRIFLFLLFLVTTYTHGYSQSAEFPVEKYKFYKRTNQSDLKKFSGVGKLFINLQSNNIEFIGIEYKDQMTVDDNKNWIEKNGPSSINPVFDFAFSDYVITSVIKIDDNYYKFKGNEEYYGRSIEGFIKLRK